MANCFNYKMNNKEILINNIERLGERYCKKYLDIWGKYKLENNWWTALDFFFGHSFMRGRRDELSNEYHQFTILVLADIFKINSTDLNKSYNNLKDRETFFEIDSILNFKIRKNLANRNSLSHPDFETEISSKNPIIKSLLIKRKIKVKWNDTTYDKVIHLGNDQDILMVLDVLSFIVSDKERMNIYNYLKSKISKSGIKTAYEDLIGIHAVGDKLATFIIRDIGIINPEVIKYDYGFAFPVDTWVYKIANKLGCKNRNIEKVKKCLIEICIQYKIEPLKFAAGLWFLGFHSLDILLEDCLGKIEI